MSLAPKRFYKNVSVVRDGGFEVALDNRKVKTPMGSVFKVANRGLAEAVAQEWRAQKDVVMLRSVMEDSPIDTVYVFNSSHSSQMHLTGLCNLCIDNPTGATKEVLVDSILNYLDTDTVLFFADGEENPELLERQGKEWQPVIDWFCQTYSVSIEPSMSLTGTSTVVHMPT